MELTFLSPAILAGIAAIAVPVVLHLVMRQTPKRMVFPAVRFLQVREHANRRQLRLRHLILLLLRCAAIVFLAAALARPSIKASGMLGSQEAPVAAAVVFDASPRMEYRDANHTRLEAAQETAHWLLTQLPANSDVAVVGSEDEAIDFAPDLVAADQRITRLKTHGTSTPLADAVEKAIPLLNKKEKQRKEIYVFTDLSRGGWPADPGGHLKGLLEAAGDIGLYVIDVGVAEPRDFALGDVRVTPEVVAKSGSVLVEVDALRLGPDEDRDVAIYMLDSKSTPPKPQIRGQKTIHWKAGAPQTIEFTIANEGLGVHQGYVKILGEDNLAADDIRYFTFDVRPAFKVLVAATKPADQHALFLTEAIAPEAFRRTGRARFQCETVAFDQLPDRNLDSYSAVCLLDPMPLGAQTWDQLHAYVEHGGGLAIWLGRNANADESFGGGLAAKLLPGKLAAIKRTEKPPVFLAPKTADLQHPLMKAFRPLEKSIPWTSFPIWQHWQLSELDKASNVIFAYSDGDPALLETVVGKGRVLTMTTPVSDPASASDPWNQLATGFKPWPFFMLSNEMLLYLAGSGEEHLNYVVGDRVELRLTEDPPQSEFVLTSALGAKGSDAGLVAAHAANRTISLSETPPAGSYLVQAGGTEGGVRRGFSANIPAAATELSRIKPEELTAILGAGRFRLVHGREEIDRSVSVGRVGRELYPLLIVLVALVLAAEHFLANRFYRSANDPGAKPRLAGTGMGDTGGTGQRSRPVPSAAASPLPYGETEKAPAPTAASPPLPPRVPPPPPPPPPPIPPPQLTSTL